MKTILVAEDFQTSRKVIVNALSRKGYTTLEAGDGAEALELFDGRSIDLLVTDFNMPNMNGAQLVEEVRKKSQYQYIPVLVLSTEINQGKKDLASAAQITAWIPKPFDLERFMKLVEKSMQ
jgi:two-component system, chemotaxis family, chemotaxis protein CheY